MRKLTILLSSPADVNEERNRLDDVVREVNGLFRPYDLHLTAWRYERDGLPDAGGDAQEIVTRQLPADYDVYVGVVCRHLGTPTARAPSGTVEELYNALQRKRRTGGREPHIFFYFCAEGGEAVEDPRAARVAAFKSQFPGLYFAYENAVDLASMFKDHLLHLVLERLLPENSSVDGWVPPSWSDLLAQRIDAAPGVREGFLDRSSARPARIFRRLDDLVDLRSLLDADELGPLLGALQVRQYAANTGLAGTAGLVAELTPRLGWSADLAAAVTTVADAAEPGSDPRAPELRAGPLRCDLLAALARIGELVDLDRSGSRLRPGRAPSASDPDDAWLAFLTREIRLLRSGIVKFTFVVPSASWGDLMKRCKSLAVETAWQELRPLLIDAGVTISVAPSEVVVSERLEVPDAVRERLAARAAEARGSLARLDHLGPAGDAASHPYEDLLPLPGTVLATPVALALDPGFDHRLSLDSDGSEGRAEELAAGSVTDLTLDPASLDPGRSYRWELSRDYGTGSPSPLAAGYFRTPSRREAALLELAKREPALARRRELQLRLGVLDEILREILASVDGGTAFDEDRRLAGHLLREAYEWTRRECPRSYRVEAYRETAIRLQEPAATHGGSNP